MKVKKPRIRRKKPNPRHAAFMALCRGIDIIERVEARCVAADGLVTPTLKEITEDEFRRVYKAMSKAAGLLAP